MQWLSVGHHDVVCDIDDVIDWTQSYGRELILQPFRRFFHLAAFDGHCHISRTCIFLFDHDIDWQVVVIDLEVLGRWPVEGCGQVVLSQICVEVACDTPVTASVGVVWRDADTDEEVAL